MHERTKKLRALMAEHKLAPEQVGELLDRTPMTVRIWRCQTEDSKVIPAQLLELLELKAWQLKALKEGIADAEAGNLISLEELRAKWAAKAAKQQ